MVSTLLRLSTSGCRRWLGFLCLCNFGLAATLNQVTQLPTDIVTTLPRFAVCPSGTVVISGDQELRVLLPGRAQFLTKRVAELRRPTAIGCDEANRLYAAIQGGNIGVFDIQSEGEIVPRSSFYVAGGPNRLLVVQDRLLVVGMARTGTSYPPLRRFALPSGAFLDAPPVGASAKSGGGINQFVVSPARKQVLYSATNPFQFICLDPDGRAVEVKQPETKAFRNVDLTSLNLRNFVGWDMHDRVFNTAVLPGGILVAQTMPGQGSPDPTRYLEVYDSELRALAHIPLAPSLGLFAGADSSGNLYFARLRRDAPGAVTVLRLTLE